MIGDPSGKTDMRKMMTRETIAHNIECFKKQMSRFIDFSEGKAMMVNNADWLMDLNYVDMLREVGPYFSVSNMLRAECYKQRMDRDGGLTFLEFNYMIMQSYDFLELYRKYGCNLQFGGDDQWSNMLGGRELIRKKLGKNDAEAMTITLLLNSEGKKMGKTEKGAHSEKELGMPALTYYQEEAVVKLIEGEWKWLERFSLGKQLERIAASLITKQCEKYLRAHPEMTEDGRCLEDDMVLLRKPEVIVFTDDIERYGDVADEEDACDETRDKVFELVADDEELTQYVEGIVMCESVWNLYSV